MHFIFFLIFSNHWVGTFGTCSSGNTSQRLAPGPSHEVWRPCLPGVDRTNEGGSRSGPQWLELGWLQVSHTPDRDSLWQTRWPHLRDSLLWMYAAQGSHVWYRAEKTVVFADTVDVALHLGLTFHRPGCGAEKKKLLHRTQKAFRERNISTIIFTDHIDCCQNCWAHDRRVVEIVSLRDFSFKECPVSPRFRRAKTRWRGRQYRTRICSGIPALPGNLTEAQLGLEPCACTQRTGSPYGGGLIC